MTSVDPGAQARARVPGPRPTRILLPADSTLPGPGPRAVPSGETPTRRGADTGEAWLAPYVSPLVHLRDARDANAWFHFCHGHHMEFLYWQTSIVACDEAAAALAAGRVEEAARWIDRLCTLIHGSAALLSFCGAFDVEVYDPLLRVSMAAQRDDFSGDMSVDFLRMMTAKHRLVSALDEAGLGEGSLRDELAEAEKYWYAQHGAVVLALHPGDSLLKEKLDSLKERSPHFDYRAYITNVVRSEQATRDYDAYFGVVRTPSMSVADYWTQAVAKVDVVHHHFELSKTDRAVLLVSDALLLTVIAERLSASTESGPDA